MEMDDFFFNGAGGNQAIDGDGLMLPDAVGAVAGLVCTTLKKWSTFLSL